MARNADEHEDLRPLLERLAAGDEQAADLLIERSVGRVRRLAHFMLKDSPRVRRWHETDDVAQAIALRLRRALREVRPASPRDFLNLAAKQVRRELCDLARREFGPQGQGAHHATGPAGPAAGRTDEPAGREHEAPGPGPATQAIWRDWLRHVEGAMTAEAREVFDLHYVQGLPQDEVARLLGVSPPTVKRRYREARELLHKACHRDLPRR
jgi:RNA polymerase sigma-70 factor (ECF subfamily)